MEALQCRCIIINGNIKILNGSATVPVHICTGTVAIVHKCTIMHKLMCVFFSSNCVKSTAFSILHNYDRADVIALIATQRFKKSFGSNSIIMDEEFELKRRTTFISAPKVHDS